MEGMSLAVLVTGIINGTLTYWATKGIITWVESMGGVIPSANKPWLALAISFALTAAAIFVGDRLDIVEITPDLIFTAILATGSTAAMFSQIVYNEAQRRPKGE